MKLNYLEFLLVNNPIRAYVQEKYELPILMNMVASNTFESVLEIGCGNGNGTKLIRKYFNPLHITAIDLDEKMIQIAQEAVPAESTIFQVMDASKLDFPNESFDAIFDFSSIHHIPNWKNCIEELKRVLKVGGKLILEEFSIDTFSGFPGRLYKSLLSHPYEQMFSTDEIVQHIENVGFRIDDIKKSNPFKMMSHFFLLASVPDIETIMKIEHIAIWAKDIERLRQFYEKYFEASSNAKYTNLEKGFSSYFLSFDSGARLEIMQMSSIPVTANDPYIQSTGLIHIAISVGSAEKVASLTAKLAENGYEVLDGPRKTGDGYYESTVLDPENNRIEVTV